MEDKLNLRDVLNILRRRWGLIASIVAIAMLFATLFLLVTTPRYTAEATLSFNPSQFQISSDNANMSAELYDRLISGEIELVHSPKVLNAVMDSEKLWNDPELTAPGLMERFSDALDTLFGAPNVAQDPKAQILYRFDRRLTVNRPDRSNFLTIGYSSSDPVKAAAIANSVANFYLEQHLQNQLTETPLAARWLQDRKEFLRERWRQSEHLVEQFKANNDLTYSGEDSLRDQQMTQLNEQLVVAKGAAEQAKARAEQVRRLLDARDYSQLSNIVTTTHMTNLRGRLAALEQKSALLATTLLPDHPSMLGIRSEVASIKRDILAEGHRALAKLELNQRAASDREALISNRLREVISANQASGEKLVKLRELERNAASDRSIYEAFLNRSNETIEQSTGELANFRLIKGGMVPTRPSFPSKLKVLLLALVGSLAAGSGLACLLEVLNPGFQAGREIASDLGIPHLASLPVFTKRDVVNSRAAPGSHWVPLCRPDSEFSRNIFALWSGLPFVFGFHPHMLAITSAVEGEGKSTVAAGLAQEAALRGVRTLLISGDPLINQEVARSMNGEDRGSIAKPGFQLFHDNETGLNIVPISNGAFDFTVTADHAGYESLINTAREHYELVVVDIGVAGFGRNSEFFRDADVTLMIVEGRRTPRDLVAQAIDVLRCCKAQSIGVVLNRADAQESVRSALTLPRANTPRAIEWDLPSPAAGSAPPYASPRAFRTNGSMPAYSEEI